MLKSSKYLMKSITDAYPEAKTAMEKLGTDMSGRFNEAVGQGMQVDAMKWAIDDIVKDLHLLLLYVSVHHWRIL